MVRNERFEIADSIYECNASLFLQGCLDDVCSDLTFKEKRAVVLARMGGWRIHKGERCRVYEWTEEWIDDEDLKEWNGDTKTIYEIPDMAEICNRLDLYP